ncbi:unnamed protein product, partial [Darwinula stevensoni]
MMGKPCANGTSTVENCWEENESKSKGKCRGREGRKKGVARRGEGEREGEGERLQKEGEGLQGIRISQQFFAPGCEATSFNLQLDDAHKDVLLRNENLAVCKTPSQNETGDMKFQMDFDSRKKGELNFTYLEDPVISYVFSGGSQQDERPRTIASGGIRIHVMGEHLQSVYKPSICFNGTTFCEGHNLDLGVSLEEIEVWIGKEKCKVTSLSRTQLICLLPDRQPRGGFDGNPPLLT